MGRQGHDTSAAAPGMRIQRSQSKMSLSASFEALAIYFPCMNSFDEEDGGKVTAGDGGAGRTGGELRRKIPASQRMQSWILCL